MKEYQDFSNPQFRINEAASHLTRLGLTSQEGSILEVGSGQGGVTAALRRRNPFSPIIATDTDTRPEVQEAAKTNNALFLEKDMGNISAQELEKLLKMHDMHTIVGMRIPAQVALHLADTLHSIGFNGDFIFSILVIPKDQDALRQLHIKHHNVLQKYIFSEDRLATEYGYKLAYPLVKDEKVA